MMNMGSEIFTYRHWKELKEQTRFRMSLKNKPINAIRLINMRKSYSYYLNKSIHVLLEFLPMVVLKIIDTLFSNRFLQNFRLATTKFFSNLHQPRWTERFITGSSNIFIIGK